MNNCIIKWTGSKRSQSNEILKYFPKKIETYYEPFVGGGSVLYALLHSDIKVKKYVCSDINSDLINLWNFIKSNPYELIKDYTNLYEELNKDININRQKQFYKDIRNIFNKNRNPSLFMFLTRTSINGLIRYNKKGDFNASFHFNRKGINPTKLSQIIKYWSKLLNENNVIFINRDYLETKPSQNDLMYLDPPYYNTKGIYFGEINFEVFWKWLMSKNCSYILSFNGLRGLNDKTYKIQSDLYDKHIYINSGNSSFTRLKKQENLLVKESLYVKIKT